MTQGMNTEKRDLVKKELGVIASNVRNFVPGTLCLDRLRDSFRCIELELSSSNSFEKNIETGRSLFSTLGEVVKNPTVFERSVMDWIAALCKQLDPLTSHDKQVLFQHVKHIKVVAENLKKKSFAHQWDMTTHSITILSTVLDHYPHIRCSDLWDERRVAISSFLHRQDDTALSRWLLRVKNIIRSL